MIKKCMLGLLMTFSMYSMNAQRIRIGVFANPVISWMSSDVSHIKSNGSRVGVDFGLMWDKFFAPHYAFSSGISINHMGGTISYHDLKTIETSEGTQHLSQNSEVAYKLQYIHFPVGIKLRTVEIGYTTYFADLGLDPMINVKARADITSSNYNVKDVGVGDEISFLYMAYHLSAGIEYRIVANTSVIAGLTYMNGFTNVTHEGSPNVVMNCIQIRIGVLF